MSFDPPPQTSRGGMTFIRFVVGTNQESAHEQTGVVAELRLLKESGDLPEYEHAHVGVLQGGANHTLQVQVTVEPI